MKYLIIEKDEDLVFYDLLFEDEMELKSDLFWEQWVPITELELDPLLQALKVKKFPTKGCLIIEDW